MREFVRDNKSLGSFRLDGIPHVPHGVPQIVVKFGIVVDGILSVTTVDKRIGKQDTTITGASTLPSNKVCFEKTVVMKSVWYLFKLKYLVNLRLE